MITLGNLIIFNNFFFLMRIPEIDMIDTNTSKIKGYRNIYILNNTLHESARLITNQIHRPCFLTINRQARAILCAIILFSSS